jgi:hypothetical protein
MVRRYGIFIAVLLMILTAPRMTAAQGSANCALCTTEQFKECARFGEQCFVHPVFDRAECYPELSAEEGWVLCKPITVRECKGNADCRGPRVCDNRCTLQKQNCVRKCAQPACVEGRCQKTMEFEDCGKKACDLCRTSEDCSGKRTCSPRCSLIQNQCVRICREPECVRGRCKLGEELDLCPISECGICTVDKECPGKTECESYCTVLQGKCLRRCFTPTCKNKTCQRKTTFQPCKANLCGGELKCIDQGNGTPACRACLGPLCTVFSPVSALRVCMEACK